MRSQIYNDRIEENKQQLDQELKKIKDTGDLIAISKILGWMCVFATLVVASLFLGQEVTKTLNEEIVVDSTTVESSTTITDSDTNQSSTIIMPESTIENSISSSVPILEFGITPAILGGVSGAAMLLIMLTQLLEVSSNNHKLKASHHYAEIQCEAFREKGEDKSQWRDMVKNTTDIDSIYIPSYSK